MPYNKWNDEWEDSPETTTPIVAEALNNIEAGIFDAFEAADAAQGDATDALADAAAAQATATAAGVAAAAAQATADALNLVVLVHYSEVTSDVAVTGTASGAATAVLAGGAVTYTAVPHIFLWSCSAWETNGAHDLHAGLYDGSTFVTGIAAYVDATGSGQRESVLAYIRFTPTAGSHTYNIKAWGNTSIVRAGTGASGATYAPTSLTILKGI